MIAPPAVIASWPKPNYINPKTHGPGLMTVACLLPSFAILIVGLRLYARFKITKAPGIDDLLILLALIFGITLSCIIMVGNQVYFGNRHVWDIPIDVAVNARINIWVSQLFYTLALLCVKTSVLLFYRRLSVSFTKTFIVAVWIGIAYNIMLVVGFLLTLLLLCRPISAYWMSFKPQYYAAHKYHCGSEQVTQPLVAILNLFGDFYSTLLPLILVSRLALPKPQKAALYGLFSLGFLVVISGAVRTVYAYQVVNVTYDFSWTLWKLWVWGEVELWVAVYAASAPALKPLFKKYFQDFPSSSSRTQHELRRDRTVHVVRSNERGGLGRVEKVKISFPKTRSPSWPSAPNDRNDSEAPMVRADTWKRSHSTRTSINVVDVTSDCPEPPPKDTARLSRPWKNNEWDSVIESTWDKSSVV